MNRFVAKGLLFALPLFAAFATIEARLTAVPNDYTVRLRLLDERRTQLNVLVLGSSHEYQGVNTDLFPQPSFNLAMLSQSLTESAELALKFLPSPDLDHSSGTTLYFPRLRTILLGISYYSLPYLMRDAGDPRLGFYIRAYGVDADASLSQRADPRNHLYGFIYGWGAVQSILRGEPAVFASAISPTGYSPYPSPALPENAGPEVFAASAVTRTAAHHHLAHEASIPINLMWIRRLAMSCRRSGVALVLATSPVTSTYADLFGRDTWRGYRAQIEELSNELSFVYRDYSQDPAFDWSDFGDADHLNPTGAAKYSRMLAGLASP